MDAREPPQCLHEVPVGARIVLGPDGIAFGPDAAAAESPAVPTAITSPRRLRIHQARESPLGLLLPVRRQGDAAEPILHAWKLAERPLGIERADERGAQSQTADRAECHASGAFREHIIPARPAALLCYTSGIGEFSCVTSY